MGYQTLSPRPLHYQMFFNITGKQIREDHLQTCSYPFWLPRVLLKYKLEGQQNYNE